MYSSSKISSMPWLNSNSSESSRKKKNIPLMYPIFEELSSRVDDPQWEKYLIDAAKGKFPKGISFNGEALIYKIGNKKPETIEISGKSNAVENFMNFIRKTTGLRTSMDLEREKDNEHRSSGMVQKEWSKIKSKAYKKLLIIDFIGKMSTDHRLTQEEKDQLLTLINLNIGNTHVSRGIKVVDDAIQEIEDLKWNPDTRIFSFPIFQSKIKDSLYKNNENVVYTCQPLEIDNIKISTLKEWSKFLKDFNKIAGKLEKIQQESSISTNTFKSNEEIESSSSNLQDSSSLI